ncbi:MAG TPA: TetR family transcriptional regulator [Jatrophihabitantaceae bacterium]|jgi:AcrR family transcriptional regulator
MGRWEPNAAGRLREAAMDLYLEQGFEQTTVAEIAARAGLTARTFFRYFTDKREVLFGGAELLHERLVRALEDAPADATPIEAVAAALTAIAELLVDREFSGRRQQVIDANAELRERELIKMATLSAALTDGLRTRGVRDSDARLAGEAGIAVFRVAFDRWVRSKDDRMLAQVVNEALSQLRTLVAAS